MPVLFAIAFAAGAGCAGEVRDDAAIEGSQYLKDERALLQSRANRWIGEGAEGGALRMSGADGAAEARAAEGDRWQRIGDAGIDDPYAADARSPVLGGRRPMAAASAAGGDAFERVLRTATAYEGAPYEYGSDREEPTTFDSSDFVHWVYLEALGIDLPRDSRAQAEYVLAHSARTFDRLGDAKPGDLLFFAATGAEAAAAASEGTINHVGLYLGDGRMIHTASPLSGGVRIDAIRGSAFEERFAVGGSVIGAPR